MEQQQAANITISTTAGIIGATAVTYNFYRMNVGRAKPKCSEFGQAIVSHI